MTFTQENINAAAEDVLRHIYPGIFYFGDRAQVKVKCDECFITHLKTLVKDMNSSCGTRSRKSIGALCTELSSRGVKWTEVNPDIISIHIGELTILAEYRKGIDLALDFPQAGYLPDWEHITSNENDIADFILFLSEIYSAVRAKCENNFLEAGRKKMISEVEFPSIESDVANFLVPRGINYTIENDNGKNILRVQIVNEIWIKKAVEMETVELDLGIIPFLIKRPDCIKRDGRGFTIFHNWSWKQQKK